MVTTLKCPKCGESNDFTLWKSGQQGFPVKGKLDKNGEIETSTHCEYDEMSFETLSCSCGYETGDEENIKADEENIKAPNFGCCMTETEMRETFENEWVHCPWCGKKIPPEFTAEARKRALAN